MYKQHFNAVAVGGGIKLLYILLTSLIGNNAAYFLNQSYCFAVKS